MNFGKPVEPQKHRDTEKIRNLIEDDPVRYLHAWRPIRLFHDIPTRIPLFLCASVVRWRS